MLVVLGIAVLLIVLLYRDDTREDTKRGLNKTYEYSKEAIEKGYNKIKEKREE